MRTGARSLLVLLALLGTAGCNGDRDQLLADLQNPRPEVRALAVKKLADESRPEDLPLFTRAAKDMASIVRGEAAGALGKSQDARVVDLLGELLVAAALVVLLTFRGIGLDGTREGAHDGADDGASPTTEEAQR